MRKRFSVLFPAVLVLLSLLLSAAHAAVPGESWKNEETGFEAVINDSAHLLSDSEISSVLDAMVPVTSYAGAGFMTSDSSAGNWRQKAESWGDSRFGRNSAYTVFIIDMGSRRLGIYSSRKVYDRLTTAKANTITDNVYRYASGQDYAGCAKEAFREISRVLEGQQISEPMKNISNVFLALICAMLVTYMLVAGRMRNEQQTSINTVTRIAGIGAATAVTGHVLKKVVHHERSSGGGHGGFGGGGGGGGGGGSHGF